jgi:hypothetical protein
MIRKPVSDLSKNGPFAVEAGYRYWNDGRERSLFPNADGS